MRAAVLHRRKRESHRDHPLGEATLYALRSFATRGHLASVRPITGAVVALATACALAASPVKAAGSQPGGALEPLPPAAVSAHELGNLINSGRDLVVAGERLNVGLLRRFYAG